MTSSLILAIKDEEKYQAVIQNNKEGSMDIMVGRFSEYFHALTMKYWPLVLPWKEMETLGISQKSRFVL
jgi:hypothetical protein